MDAFSVIGNIFSGISSWCSSKIIPGFAPFTIWDAFVGTFVLGIVVVVWNHMYTFGNK